MTTLNEKSSSGEISPDSHSKNLYDFFEYLRTGEFTDKQIYEKWNYFNNCINELPSNWDRDYQQSIPYRIKGYSFPRKDHQCRDENHCLKYNCSKWNNVPYFWNCFSSKRLIDFFPFKPRYHGSDYHGYQGEDESTNIILSILNERGDFLQAFNENEKFRDLGYKTFKNLFLGKTIPQADEDEKLDLKIFHLPEEIEKYLSENDHQYRNISMIRETKKNTDPNKLYVFRWSFGYYPDERYSSVIIASTYEEAKGYLENHEKERGEYSLPDVCLFEKGRF